MQNAPFIDPRMPWFESLAEKYSSNLAKIGKGLSGEVVQFSCCR